MTERPIIFQGWGVRAIQKNLKTQTRRTKGLDRINKDPVAWEYLGFDPIEETHAWRTLNLTETVTLRCPYGVPGDRLWVRETWCPGSDFAAPMIPDRRGKMPIYYRADTPTAEWDDFNWRSSIFMPRRLARLLMEITEVRAERVQEITYADVLAEGIPPVPCLDDGCSIKTVTDIARLAYAKEWDLINGKAKYVRGAGFGGETERFESTVKWSNNPWVFPITFRRIEA